MIGLQFEDMTQDEVDLQDFCTGFTTTVGYEDDYKTLAPCIQIQDRDAQGNILGTGNTFYYYIYDAAKDSNGNVLVPGWADAAGNYVGDDSWKPAANVPANAGFWFKDPSQKVSITFKK
jgi:hypothetical protein